MGRTESSGQVEMSDRERYRQLVEHHADDVVRYFVRWRLPAAEIDDLAQEVFLQAWKSLDGGSAGWRGVRFRWPRRPVRC